MRRTLLNALKAPVKGDDRKVLCLLAVYADEGEHSPPMSELKRRLKLPVSKIDKALVRLSKQGLLYVKWAGGKPGGSPTQERNRYGVLL